MSYDTFNVFIQVFLNLQGMYACINKTVLNKAYNPLNIIVT